MLQKDMVIGCITNYGWDEIKFWVNSLDRSGFIGTKAMICYNVPLVTVQQLVDRGYKIFGFKQEGQILFYKEKFSIVVERFLHMWQFLKDLPDRADYRYVVATDVRDIVFQSNPSAWLEAHLGDKKINVTSESIPFRHDVWSAPNMFHSYGEAVFAHMADKIVHNAGTIAGEFNTMLDLFLNVYLTSLGGKTVNPDQAALNILLQLAPYRDITRFTPSEEGWACNAGTTVDPLKIEGNRPHLNEPSPTFDGQYVRTAGGKIYALAHQYDRVPEWKQKIEEIYG